MVERSDDIRKEIYNFKIVHGTVGVSHVYTEGFRDIPNISKDVKIVMITNNPYQNPYNKMYTDNLDVEYIILNKPEFKCGVDLIVPLYEYIQTIDSKYILYMDTRDTVILNDIMDPQSLLDTYNCKILFNAEDDYYFPDHPCVPKDYIKKYAEYNNEPEHFYYENRRNKVVEINTKNLQSKIECFPHRKSLNAGLFLGEREYMVEVLRDMISYMNDDPTKGYPYGEIENQKLWQYMQSICRNGEIEIDYLNLYFLWTHHFKFDCEIDNPCHFNYFYKLKK